MKSRPVRPRSSSHPAVRRRGKKPAWTLALLVAAIGGVVAATQPARLTALVPEPSPRPEGPVATAEPAGISRAVDLTVALPGDSVTIPLELGPDSAGLQYEWVAVGDTVRPGFMLPLTGFPLYAPGTPGYYHLALMRDSQQVVLNEPMLAVMVPFQEKRAGWLNGYRIGTYPGERKGVTSHPDGFLVLQQSDTDLKVSTHLTLGAFMAHDGQQAVWPKYLALDPRLLDKLELVVSELERRFSRMGDMQLQIDVHSGFRTPSYNRTVPLAADESRHQFGDAADVTFDANGDGLTSRADIAAIVQAVDTVEAQHPDLAGGLGIYTSRRYTVPYVHIDTRGERMRWRG